MFSALCKMAYPFKYLNTAIAEILMDMHNHVCIARDKKESYILIYDMNNVKFRFRFLTTGIPDTDWPDIYQECLKYIINFRNEKQIPITPELMQVFWTSDRKINSYKHRQVLALLGGG